MKKTIDVYEHMGEVLKGVKSGVLITGKADDKVNSMTISWGMVGIEWGKPIFVTFIRENRFTRSLIEKTGEFTVSIPIDDSAKKILGFCGSKSGRVDYGNFGRICANAMDRGIENIFAYSNDMVIFLISFSKKIDILVSFCADLIGHIIVNPDRPSTW